MSSEEPWKIIKNTFSHNMKYVLITCLYFVLLFFLLSFFGLHGLVYSDEGYIVNTASRILSQELLYRDIHFVYTPLSAWITCIAFLFDQSILSERIITICVAFLSIIFLYIFLVRFTKSMLLTQLLVLLFLSWGPIHIN